MSGDLDLGGGPLLGRVTRLDRSRVNVELSDPNFSERVTVSDLVALPVGGDFLIGLVEAVTRRPVENGSPVSGQAGLGEPAIELKIMPVGTYRSVDGAGQRRFARGPSGYPRIGGSCHLVDRERLSAFMSILSETVGEGERLALGHYVAGNDAPAIADANRLFQRHVALLGSTGAGKSWAVSLMLERASRLRHANMIVFDLHGEYAPLAHRTDERGPPVARAMRIAGPGELGQLADDVLYLPYWLLERDELMTLTLNPVDPHAPDQVLRFSEHVQTLKRVSLVDAGREAAAATFTIDSPIPFRLDHLVQMLQNDDTHKVPQGQSARLEPGPFFGRMTGFISRLQARVADPRYGFIFNPPEETLRYDWLPEVAARLLAAGPGGSGIKVIDLSEVPTAILPIVVAVIARLVYDVQFWMDPAGRTPVCLVCDEAHQYLPTPDESRPVHRASLEAFESIAKEGRKYGVALLVVSQRPTDVSRTILSQCNNFIVMRLTNDHDQAIVERLLPETLSGVRGVLPLLDVGEAVVIGDALLLPTRVKFDPPVIKPDSATQPYWSLWATRSSSEQAITAGVEALRNQMRVSE